MKQQQDEDPFNDNAMKVGLGKERIDLGLISSGVSSKHSSSRNGSMFASRDMSPKSQHSLHLIDLSSGTGVEGNALARVDSVKVASRKGNSVVLHPMTVLFPESKVTAILGPSGSGKSTLLNFLTGTIAPNLNAEGMVNLTGQMGFVPQEDHLHGFYTCRTYIDHYNRLAGVPDTFSNAKLSTDLLIGLGMENHADTIVGDIFRKGLSGGQKRRLSIALEALSRPETLLLDEPTSGLDSESAYHVMKFLDEYAKVSGRRVILTIHQPSSFIWQMIDNVVLLSKGKLMYQGPREEIETFFAKHGSPCPPEYNPADHYVAMVNDEFRVHPMSVDEWEIAFNEWNVENLSSRKELELGTGGSTDLSNSPARRLSTTETTALPSSRGNSYQAALELTRRYLVNLYRNPGIIGTRVIMYAMLSIAIGTMFYDLGGKNTYSSIISRAALMFYCVSFFVFMSIAAVPFAMIERGIVEKEVRNGYYHPAIYQISQTIASIPGTFLLALITTAITLSMTNLRAPLWYFLNIFLVLNCAEALAHLVSHLVQHFVIGIAIIAGIYGIFMLLPGFILVPSDFPGWLTWTYNIAFHTYSWRSLMYKEFSGDVVFDSVEFPTGMDVLKFYEIEDVNPASDMIVLLIYAVIINVISIIVLYTKNFRHKGKQVKTGDWK